MSSLRHILCKQGRGLNVKNVILRRGILAATQRIGQPMTKGSCVCAPPNIAPSCCTAKILKEICIQLGWAVLRPVATEVYQPIGKIASSPFFHPFTRWKRPEAADIDPDWTCKDE